MKYLNKRLSELKKKYSEKLSSVNNFTFGSFDRVKLWTEVIELKHRIEELKLTIKNLSKNELHNSIKRRNRQNTVRFGKFKRSR